MKYNLYVEDVSVDAVFNMLGGVEGAKCFLRGELVLIRSVERVFETFRKIVVGTLTSAEHAQQELRRVGMQILDYADDDILKKVSWSGKEVEVEFIVASNAELGFKNGTQYRKTCERIVKLGYALCKSEDGPAFRLGYTDQPMDEWLIMAMEHITDHDGDPGVWGVGRGEDSVWLDTSCRGPGGFYDGSNRFVFRRK